MAVGGASPKLSGFYKDGINKMLVLAYNDPSDTLGTTIAANTATQSYITGTPVVTALPDHSIIVSGLVDNADIVFLSTRAAGNNSHEIFRIDSSAGLIVFNEASNDWDFRVEGDNNANLFVLDAGLDSVAFGGAVVAGAAFTHNNLTNRAAVTSVGHQIHVPAQTQNFTNASSTLAIGAAQVLGVQTLTGSNATLTFTDAATLYIAGIPVAGANVAITNTALALWVDAGTARFDGAVLLNSPTAGLGYSTGAGGTVTQMTSKSTGVTLNTVTGAITMNGAALAADTTVAFTLTDSAIAATDTVLVVHESAGTLGAYSFGSTPAGGSVSISVHNNTPGSLSEAIVLRFFVLKSVNA